MSWSWSWDDKWGNDDIYGDRWNESNKEEGWDMDDIRAEFDDFFASTEQADIYVDPQLEKESIEVEIVEALSMYERGIQSGKVSVTDD